MWCTQLADDLVTLHCKKRLSFFLFPAGMSHWPGIIKLFSARDSLVPSRDVINQTLPGRELLNYSRPEPVFVNVYGAEDSISLTYVAWRAGTKNRVVVPARQAGNRLLVSLKGLQILAQREFGYGHPGWRREKTMTFFTVQTYPVTQEAGGAGPADGCTVTSEALGAGEAGQITARVTAVDSVTRVARRAVPAFEPWEEGLGNTGLLAGCNSDLSCDMVLTCKYKYFLIAALTHLY